MGQNYHLEFYVPKEPLTTGYVGRAIEAMARNGLRVVVNEKGAPGPSFGIEVRTLSSLGMTPERVSRLSVEETIDLLVQYRGGSISFLSGTDPLEIRLRLFPTGRNLDRAKHLGESETGNVPFGSIDVNWPYSIGDEESKATTLLCFEKTIAVAHSLYRAFRPVYGFSYTEEIGGPRSYNLVPTEKNIAEQGPRDLFPINFWSPAILNSLKVDWARLAAHSGLSASVLDDGGVLIHCTPDQFVANMASKEREKGERFLGWRSLNPDRR